MTLFLMMVRKGRIISSDPAASLIDRYLKRTAPYTHCSSEHAESEAKLFDRLSTISGRTKPYLVLLDGSGQLLSSGQIAQALGKTRDAGTQHIIFAIGPADGWSPQALGRADLILAFGRITLPHELAAVIAAEQIYRAFTILAGHPYHSGH